MGRHTHTQTHIPGERDWAGEHELSITNENSAACDTLIARTWQACPEHTPPLTSPSFTITRQNLGTSRGQGETRGGSCIDDPDENSAMES